MRGHLVADAVGLGFLSEAALPADEEASLVADEVGLVARARHCEGAREGAGFFGVGSAGLSNS